tara:strand:+ start:3322 stop:3951 length:630 start_codon:yes stop_codon:yes gene_type:complete
MNNLTLYSTLKREEIEMSEENELFMDDDAWNNRITDKVQPYMNSKEMKEMAKADEEIEDSFAVIEMNIKRGNKRPDMRKKYWNSILLEGRNLPNWPIKKGKESNLPIEVQTTRDTIGELVFAAHVAFWNDNPVIQHLSVISDRNKELGGSPFPNAEEYAASKEVASKQRVVKYYNTNRWNGEFTLEDGLNITPPAQETTEEAEGETDAS